MVIYLASSWRNEHQPQTLDLIRRAGYEVYDFRNPTDADGGGFSWTRLDGPGYDSLPPPSMWSAADLALALRHPVAIRGHGLDQAALDHATACVLLLPCGSSAHLEAGYCAGRGVPTVVYAPSAIREPELMYLTFGPTPIVTTHEELMAWLARAFSPVAERLDPHLQVHRRQAGLARARIADIAGGHRGQRVTATISDPIEVRELPTLGGRPPRPAPPITALPPADCPPIRDWLGAAEPPSAEALPFLRRTAMGGSIVSSATMTPAQIAAARAADRMLVTPEGYGFVYVPAQRIVSELRALVAVDDDGPEGSRGPSWVLGQIRQLLGIGITVEHDAVTLDLRGPGVELDELDELGGES